MKGASREVVAIRFLAALLLIAGAACGNSKGSSPAENDDKEEQDKGGKKVGKKVGHRACEYREARKQILQIAAERPYVSGMLISIQLPAKAGEEVRWEKFSLIEQPGPPPKPLIGPILRITRYDVRPLASLRHSGGYQPLLWGDTPLTAARMRKAASTMVARLRATGAARSPLPIAIDSETPSGWVIAVARAAQMANVSAVRLLFEQTHPVPRPQKGLELLEDAFRTCRALLQALSRSDDEVAPKLAELLASCPCGVDGDTIVRWVFDTAGRIPLTEISVPLARSGGGIRVRLDPRQRWATSYEKVIAAAARGPVDLWL